jgi:putative ABC transport system ATP-binding protein
MAEQGSNRRTDFRDLIRFFKLDQRDFVSLAIYGAVIGLLSLVVPLSAQTIVNTVAFGGLTESLFTLTFFLAFALTASAILVSAQVWIIEMLQRRMIVRVSFQLAERMPRVRQGTMNNRRNEEFINQFMDVFALRKTLTDSLVKIIDAVLLSLTGILVLAFYHPWLLAFDLIALAGSFVVLVLYGKGAIKTVLVESKKKYRLHDWLERIAAGKVTGISHSKQSALNAETQNRVEDYLQSRDAHFRITFRQVK